MAEIENDIASVTDPDYDLAGIPRTSLPPDLLMYRRYIAVGHNLYDHLLRNDIISSKEFEEIMSYVKRHADKKEILHISHGTDLTLQQMIDEGIEDEYQDFSYPIIFGDKLIVHQNSYRGLKYANQLGLIGSGQFLVYQCIEDRCTLIIKILTWIT